MSNGKDSLNMIPAQRDAEAKKWERGLSFEETRPMSKGRWDARKLQQRCDKAMSNPAMNWEKTREKMLDMVRGDLISQRWLISTFALAYLNVAAWRGLKPPFGQPKAFSEWVPLSLIFDLGIGTH